MPLVDDLTYLRRVTFDLVGRPPTANEIRRYIESQTPDKRGRLVDRLLTDPAYGQNWAEYWRDVVMYRRSETRGLVAARTMTEKLAQDFNSGFSWADIASQFITATGDIAENGATALIFAQQGRPEETAAEVSRIFLGIQIQCAQCHDHPTDDWTREQFHELAAFFPRIATRPVRSDGRVRSFEIVARDFEPRRRRTNNVRYVPQLEHTMSNLEDLDAPGKKIQPVFFVTGQSLPFGSSDTDRRSRLAQWIVSPRNPWFATALVNRLWTELIGAGFYEHVDDLGPGRSPRAPKALAHLVAKFVSHDYDVKWLMKTIMSTKAYQRESRSWNYENVTFTHTFPQRLRSDQLFRALTQAVGTQTVGRGRNRQVAFSQVFGFDPSIPGDNISSTVPQALALMNSPGIESLIGSRAGVVQELVRKYPKDTDLIDQIYIQCFSRWPSRHELSVAGRHLRSAENRIEGARDLTWALVNSTEFLFRK